MLEKRCQNCKYFNSQTKGGYCHRGQHTTKSTNSCVVFQDYLTEIWQYLDGYTLRKNSMKIEDLMTGLSGFLSELKNYEKENTGLMDEIEEAINEIQDTLETEKKDYEIQEEIIREIEDFLHSEYSFAIQHQEGNPTHVFIKRV